MKSLTPCEFSTHDGPFVQILDKTLKECGVERQAYYGGTFVGNHEHTPQLGTKHTTVDGS